MVDLAVGTEDLQSLYNRYHGPGAESRPPTGSEPRMKATWALFRKNLLDARWMLLTISLALFGLSWLFVHVAHRIEVRMKAVTGGGPPTRMLRALGGNAMDFSTAAIEMAFWNHPFVLLMFAVWAIARGSASVAGEIERGTMDLILSRPITRFAYLSAQIAAALFGLVLLAGADPRGNQVGAHYNTLNDPPSVWLLAKPSLNLAAFGFAIYGYTLFCSTLDLVRWRPNLIASVATLAGFVAQVVANIPSLEDYKWLEKLSIFKAYNPVEVVTKGETFAFNAGILGLIGLDRPGPRLRLLPPFRDLPAGS